MVEKIGLDQDPDTLREVLGNFIRVRNTQNISNGVDYMVDVLRRGMPDYGVSRKRPTEACCQCAKELFDSSHTMELVICEVCDRWVHKGRILGQNLTCYEEHMKAHIPGLLTRGTAADQHRS